MELLTLWSPFCVVLLAVLVAILAAKLTAVKATLNTTITHSEKASKHGEELQLRVDELKNQNVRLETQLANDQKLLAERDKFETLFGDKFEALSANVLKSQHVDFSNRYEQLFKTGQGEISKIANSLEKEIKQLREQGGNNTAAFKQQMINIADESRRLGDRAQGLENALRKPHIRGGWAEQKLQNVLNASGLCEGVDYITQETFDKEKEGKRVDFIVKMPEGRRLILDSKISLEAVIDNENGDSNNEEKKKQNSKRHVKLIRAHVETLSKKKYPQSVQNSPDFVVMVLLESDFYYATKNDPSLIEWANSQNIIIVTASSLVALLRALQLTWKQVRVVEKSQEISNLSKKLYHYLTVFADRYVKIGASLRKTVENYNHANLSWDRDLVVEAEKFKRLKLPVTGEIKETNDIVVEPSLITKIPDRESRA